MLRIGFEPTIAAFERAKTVHALNRVVIVISFTFYTMLNGVMIEEW
jgi:hypothetical protein